MNPFALPRIARRLVPVAACALAAACLPQSAVADEFDTLNLVLSDSLRYDANVFRTPDSSGPPLGFTTKSDRINVFSVGLKIDKPYAQQRFQLDATQTMTRYDVFSYLNADTHNYRGAWLWHLSPRVSGTLSTERTQAEVPFVDVGGFQRNVRTTDNRSFNLDGWMFGGWHLLAGFTQRESKTEQKLLGQPSSRSRHMEAGLRYEAGSGNAITVMQRWMPADVIDQSLDPVNLIETNYRDTESELKVNWKPSGNSSFDGSLTRKERRNEHFAQRDFSGLAGHLGYLWTPTGKLTFHFSADRKIGPYAALGNVIANSSYKVDNILSFEPVWQVDAKIAVRLRFARTATDFRGPVFAVSGPPRSDDFRTALVGVDWSPLRNVSLRASLQRERRSSNDPGFEYGDTIGSLSASVTF